MSDNDVRELPSVAAELGVDPGTVPPLIRRPVPVGDGREVSVLVWGESPPELVFLHGGGQNAHTWDLVAVGLARPAVAVDLPGHGHSSWRDDGDYAPVGNAEAVGTALDAVAPKPGPVVGMSLGGLTALRLAAQRPDLVSRLVMVDVTPGVMARAASMTNEERGATALVRGAEYFGSQEEMVEQAVQASPRRPAAAVRRGVVHNSVQAPDGRWRWRYDIASMQLHGVGEYTRLWEDLESLRIPVMLVRGGASVFVSDEDAAEFQRRGRGARIETVPGAGHAVQSDRPAELTALISDFAFTPHP
jgi:pimeloyl-ACP methyl ester carboxylesterase